MSRSVFIHTNICIDITSQGVAIEWLTNLEQTEQANGLDDGVCIINLF